MKILNFWREKMSELIDREDLKSAIRNKYASLEDRCEINEIINAQPTVDSVSVVHGHWIYDPNGMDWNLGAWRCSKCGCKNNNIGGDERINPLLFAGSKYCPNCGAKMDEDTEREHD
jgi:hypothetical protein